MLEVLKQSLSSHLPSHYKDRELLYIRETNAVGRFNNAGISYQSKQSHENFLWTCTEDRFIERFSLIQQDSGREEPSIPKFSFTLPVKREELHIQLNSSDRIKSICNETDLQRASPRVWKHFETELDNAYIKLGEGHKGWFKQLAFERNIQELALVNSLGIAWTAKLDNCNLGFYLAKGGQVIKSGYRFNVPELADLVAIAGETPEVPPDSALGSKVIRGGKSPVLLSPWVVEVLCQLVFNVCKPFSSTPEKILNALPEDFRLSDDPSLGRGFNSASFDHEGSVTFKKILSVGNRLQSQVSDLRSAQALHLQNSSGNGYRTGIFFGKAAENIPGIHPNYLHVEPGKKSMAQIFKDEAQFVYLTDVCVPADRSQDLNRKGALVTLRGYMVSKGKMISRVYGRSFPDRLLLSSYPESFGSLLDPQAQILSEGAGTRTGWFPFVFLPIYTWS